MSAIRPNIEWPGNPTQYFLHTHRTPTFLALSALVSSLALDQTSTLIPGVVALSVFHTYSRFLFPSLHARRDSFLFVLAIAAGSASTNLSSSREALDSKVLAYTVLTVLYLLASTFVVGILYVDWFFTSRFPQSAASLFWFPAMWATMWRLVAYVSPVGNLLTWYRPTVVEGYRWIVPILGPGSQDWITAAWAVVISQTFQTWFINPQQTSEYDDESGEPTTDRRAARKRVSGSAPVLGSCLVLLLLPSFIGKTLPLPVADVENTTPVAVGCILPPFQRYKHHDPTLEDYIEESKKYRSMSRLLLWPEGAVSFKSVEERDKAFVEIRRQLPGVYVGVSYELLDADPKSEDPSKGRKRTGLAVLSDQSKEPHLTYWKQHLVPIAESYRLVRGTEPPSMSNISLPVPKGVPALKWDPNGTRHRELSITGAICLDFAFPLSFRSLESRPSLILAPARTWESSVGMSMWLQAKQRAVELDSMVLWCDGGSGGVSGIGGGGFDEVTQIGSGSWVRTIGVEWPFNEKPSVYGRFEDWTVLLYWLAAFGFTLDIPLRQLKRQQPIALGEENDERTGRDHNNLIDF